MFDPVRAATGRFKERPAFSGYVKEQHLDAVTKG